MLKSRFQMRMLPLVMMGFYPSLRGDEDGDKDKKFTQADIDAAVAAGIEAATTGLKSKNQEILDELKQSKDGLKLIKDFGGPEELKKLLDVVGANEDIKLIKDGKFDEVLQRKLEKKQLEWEEEMKTLRTENETLKTSASTYQSKYQQKLVSDNIQREAIAAGVRKEAIDDVVMRANGIFKAGDDDAIEARGADGKIVKIGDNVLTPKLFIENLKKSHPHYWPGSVGSGSQGSGEGDEAGDALIKVAATGDAKAYRNQRRGIKK